ncbi:hypothetical protein CDL12_03118 [Handroanthus impetiginosus]|uniref:COBRA C-terminal domain-containing protein n=1 Tax=Handroanthus impetiginosus TaxID=429701 RepID=A0A2G9I328_9LAMI|nr:hypothetical protein CDL12_03118 [Handroanthus impetiginosus]
MPTFIIILSILFFFPTSFSQPSTSSDCNGVLITYSYQIGDRIRPFLDDSVNQPYKFVSNLTVQNNGPEELKDWRVFVGFNNGELLVSAKNAVLDDGEALPANVSGGVVFSGSPVSDLKSAIETAGDVDLMEVRVELVGTQFGGGRRGAPLLGNISLANDGFSCRNSTTQENETTVCCLPDPNAKTDVSRTVNYSPLQTGDLTIMYDVTMTYESNYWAQVTITNHNPFSRLENWNLSFDWMENEFINAMRGAYPKVVNTNDCLFGSQGEFYKEFDFSKALSCDKRPTIIDLPLSKANDTNLGLVPFCCRNGTILPPSMDLMKSKSSFQMQVYKMPPGLNRTQLSPPRNWKINSTIGAEYLCGHPIRVPPTLFPEATGLPVGTAAVATWQVVCNITKTEKKPKCCVSFSSFFNDSVIPCNTCACGCDNGKDICNANEQAILLPAQALLIPFENRTRLTEEFAALQRRKLPNPLPCADNCGVSINWHLLSDYRKGWTARITLFNWGETDIADWFAAVELKNAIPGFEKVYSMDGKVLNSTIFLQGFPGSNYLIAERNGSNPKKDPRVPGTQQSVISFTKKEPGIDVGRVDGFPTKVYFNGEECSIPVILPSDAERRAVVSAVFSGVLLILVIFIVMQ